MRRIACCLALAAGMAFACPAAAQTPRPFDVDGLLRKEDLGAARVSPDGRWVAVGVQGRYDALPAYTFAQYNWIALSRLEVFDAVSGQPRHILSDPDHEAGYIAGPFSPDGRRMVVYRLTTDRWSLGVLSLETGAVRWTDLSPEESQFGRTVAWRNADELLGIFRPDHSLPIAFRIGNQAQDRVRALWEATESGRRVGGTWIPSGARRNQRSQPPPLQLRSLNLATGEDRVLAEGAIYDFMLSPDRSRLVVMEEREDLQPQPGVAVRVGDPMRRRALRLIAMEGPEVRLDRDLDFSPYFMSWRPDSGAVLAFARPPGGGDFEDDGAYVVIDTEGHVTEPGARTGRPALVRSIWGEPVALGGWLADVPLVRVKDEGGEPRWRSQDSSVDLPALGADRLIDWAGKPGILRGDRLLSLDGAEITTGLAVNRGDLADAGNRAGFTSDADTIWALRREGCVDAADPTGSFCVDDLSAGERVLAAGHGVMVTRQDRPDGASVVRIHSPEGSQAVATVNAARAAYDWGELIEVPHEGPAGEALSSWLLMPPNLPAGARPPLVVDVYVGRTFATPPRNAGRGATLLQNNPAVIAGGGYAVLMVSLPNPPQGRFSGEALAQRLVGIIDRAAADGRVNADRVALIGHSYGAYNVLSAAPHSERFATVIASNGAADHSTTLILPLFYRVSPDDGVPIGTSIGWAETGQAAVGRFPEEAERYVSLSPLYDVGALTMPTLLIETDLDRPRYGALFGALYRLNREAAWLNYFGEGHTVASPANVRDLHARILDWLARYLGPPSIDTGLPVAGPDLQDGG